MGRLGSPKVHLMNILCGIRIGPHQLQDTIRCRPLLLEFTLGFIIDASFEFFREHPDVMRIIINSLVSPSLKPGHSACIPLKNRDRIDESMFRSNRPKSTISRETACNWLQTCQEPACCYLWQMCAFFMIINDRSRMQSFEFELDWVYTGVHTRNVWKSSNRAVLILWSQVLGTKG